MAGLNFIQTFFVKRFLTKWKKRSHTSVYTYNAEWAEALSKKSYFVHRTYTYNSLCVDIYWYLKRSKKEKHVDYIYVRCPWEKVKEVINETETEKLPQVLAESKLI